MSDGFRVVIDSREVIQALEEFSAKDTRKTFQRAVKVAGNYLAGKARGEAPPRPRKMRSRTRARNAKRDKPGTVVSTRHKLGPIFQHGTVDRFTKAGAFRGRMTANPYITRTADQHGDEALGVVEKEVWKALEL